MSQITGITVLGPLKTIHPLYQIFGVRLEMINFDNIINCDHKEHATDLNDSIEDIGLICPIVLAKKDNKYIIADGCSRYNFIKNHANSSICYVAKNEDEEKFLQQMNKKVFKLHQESKSSSSSSLTLNTACSLNCLLISFSSSSICIISIVSDPFSKNI
jgi:hypothetical protein